MRLVDILPPARIACGARASSKKKVLEQMAEMFAQDMPYLTQAEIFHGLLERERLGTTALGKQVAIPHARMQADKFEPMAAFIHLSEGVDFEANDDLPVDILFALLIPADGNNAYLEMLAQLAAMLNDEQFVHDLRATESAEEAYALITRWQTATPPP